jgi:hypothetical protein
VRTYWQLTRTSSVQRLALHYSQKYIVEKIEHLAFLIAERPQDVKKPAEWLRKAIEDNYNTLDGFIPQEQRELLRAEAARYTELAKEHNSFNKLAGKLLLPRKQRDSTAYAINMVP